MASTPMITILPLMLLISAAGATTTTAISNITVYEALETFNFPAGLIPKGALGYDLDESTGKFNVYLDGSCSFSLEGSYQLSYKSKFGGQIAENKLSNLSGVSVKVLFFWLNIVEVTRTDDDLELSVGIASASFPIDNFLECPQCGCGLDCNGAEIETRRMKMTMNSDGKFVSSA